MSDVRTARLASGLVMAILGTGTVSAAVAPREATPVSAKEFRHPQMQIDNRVQRVEELPAAARGALLDALADLGVSSSQFAYVDPRTGRFATLLPVEPLLPGTGEGNSLTWADKGQAEPASVEGWKKPAWDALVAYIGQRSAALGIDVAELAQPGRVTVHDDGALVQITASRVVGGVPVRDSYLTAVINHGNLVLFGAQNWGTVRVSTTPAIDSARANQALGAYLRTAAPAESRRKPLLAIVPLSAGPLESLAAPDRGLDYRLVWVLSPQFANDMGTWEALVDAHSGEMIAFQDTNQYQSVRKVQGGVYPVSNDLVPPDGIEQPGWPFPFADVATSGGNFFSDTGGNLPVCATGNITSTLNGKYVRIADVCGAISLTAPGNVDFGVSTGTNCITPGFGGPGNTHASRTGYFELNKLIEQARGQLPNNAWLQQQLTANMNINLTCNAFWNGSTVNFYHQAGACNNLGEIAAVFDHEWGHGLDDNDANGVISNPGEGIADIYMALRLNESCVGRNALAGGANCTGYGDPCTACSGFRDIDWAKHASGQPRNINSIFAICPAAGSLGPCARETHCESMVYTEVLWDLFNRDLITAGYTPDTALEIATRTTYLGSGPVGTVYQCVQGSGGCPASGGYLNYLAADDDNGNITTGTPHFQAIHDAFDRHGIGCPTPVTGNSGCALAPNAAPTVTATAEDKGVRLSWTTVPGGVKYRVYRTEGVFACDFGKVLLGETFGTTWSDTGLQNGRPYSYTVAAVGLSNTCLGPMSSCNTATPVAGGNLTPDPATATAVPITGDGDPFVDSCETVTVGFNVANTGTGAQTNVRIAAVQPLSHPAMQVLSLGSPTPTLAACANAVKAFNIKAVDLVPDAVARFRVDVTSDEMFPAVRSVIVQFANTEGNNQFVASRTYDFEAGAEGWAQVTGTFNRTNAAPGGAGGAGTFYFQSSAFLDNQCDEVQSPVVSLTATSTLSLQNNYDIEPFSAGSWYDANVGRVDVGSGARTVVAPDGGRPYNASGPGGVCGLDQQAGWAANNLTWGPSTWTAGALGSASVVGQPMRLNIKYGTDAGANAQGFRFDQVTLTNFNEKIADGQSNQCVAGNQPPIANPDNSNSGTFGPVNIAVLANDTEPEAQCMRVAAVTTPANGTAIINSVSCPNNDTVTYIPNLTCGPPCNDSFQYTVSDGNGGTATATVTINQVPVNLQGFKVE
jgi:hypothetical protein